MDKACGATYCSPPATKGVVSCSHFVRSQPALVGRCADPSTNAGKILSLAPSHRTMLKNIIYQYLKTPSRTWQTHMIR